MPDRGAGPRAAAGDRAATFALVACALLVAAGCTRAPAPHRRDAGREGGTAHAELPESCRPDRHLAARARTAVGRRLPMPPALPILRLVDRPFRVEGAARPGGADASPAFALDEAALAALAPTVDGTSVRYEVPFPEGAIRDAVGLVLEVVPAGATHLSVRLLGDRERATDRDRRTVSLPLPSAPEGDASRSHAVRIDLLHTFRDNFRLPEDQLDLRPRRVRVAFVGARGTPRIASLAFEDERTLHAGAGARGMLRRRGVVRPGFHVRAGATLVFPVTIPATGATGVFHLDHRTGGLVRIGVREGGRTTERQAIAAGNGFRAHRIDLRDLAGREVELTVTTDQDVAFVGDPTLVTQRAGERPPDVVLYLVDDLLATQLGAFRNPRDAVSPTIDRMMREGLSFARMRSTSPWTKPAVPTLLTGVHPSVHGVGAHDFFERLPTTVPRITDRFRERGYRTASIAASPLGSSLSGLEHGFDVAVTPAAFDGSVGPMGQPTAELLHRRLLTFLDEDAERPFFAFVHSLDVHEHLTPYFERGAHADDRPYDRALRQQDRALGELLEALARRGRDVLFVLVSDHGEAFGEYGRHGHGLSLHQSQLHVPLVFHRPGSIPAAVIDDLVSLPDVAPTILDLLGLSPLPDVDGISLAGYAFAPDVAPVHAFVTSGRAWFPNHDEFTTSFALERDDGTKFVVDDAGRRWRFVLSRDPCERADAMAAGAVDDGFSALERERTRLAERARAFAARHPAAPASATAPSVDADDVARLRSLGYVR